MNKLSDNHLMLQVKAGEISKMSLLFERHHKALFGYFYRQSSDIQLSEDLVQSVYYRMLKYRHTYRGDGEFVYWMYSLARNVYADQYRKKNPLRFSKELDDSDMSRPGKANIQHEMEMEESHRRLHLALGKLSPEKREAIILSRFQEQKYATIAKLQDCTETAVKTRIHRALKELREILISMDGDGTSKKS